MVLVSHSSNFHNWPLLALLVALVLHRLSGFKFCHPIYDHWVSGDQEVESLTQSLSHLYCGTTALETAYIEDDHEVTWLCNKYQEIKDLPVQVQLKI